jgi:hypothetical protein
MNSFILHCKKYMNSYITRVHICMNSYILTIEFIEYMNLYIVWVHTFYKTRNKNFALELNHRPQYMHYHTATVSPGSTVLFSIYTLCVTYDSHEWENDITTQIVVNQSVPYNKPLVPLCQIFGCGGKWFLVLLPYLEYNRYIMGCRNRYSEGTEDGQMTPRGYPNINSYVKKLRVLVFQIDRQTDRPRNTPIAHGLEELFQLS